MFHQTCLGSIFSTLRTSYTQHFIPIIFLVASFRNIRHHKCKNYSISYLILMFSMNNFWPFLLRVYCFFRDIYKQCKGNKRKWITSCLFCHWKSVFLNIGCIHALFRDFGWIRIVKSHSILCINHYICRWYYFTSCYSCTYIQMAQEGYLRYNNY